MVRKIAKWQEKVDLEDRLDYKNFQLTSQDKGGKQKGEYTSQL